MDYCVQEGFAINVLWADKTRYTATCYAACCVWRIHSSRLADGITWAIKKIEPNVHTCGGLETYNPICTVKWGAMKLLEDIRANPDIPGKALNELLFQRYGVYMRKSSVYNLKNYAVEKLFGGYDQSYADIPAYIKILCETNPDSKAYFSSVESESLPRQLLFDKIFISFTAMWKGFLAGCRPLIGVDGTHSKGNYGGILLSAVALDANNEIFPLAYAVVSVEDKENWSWFFWNLYNLVKDSSRGDWTIISNKQKGIDLALMDVWPTAKRRYCCRHISRNYKKQFAGPLMYILFWRACNATSQFTSRKAMEKLKESGGDSVMAWFAELGDSSTWSKHRFDPNVCNDSNSSNFVESFNSTLGIDRCRPIMKALKNISKDTISCKAYMSKPGEYEIHEGKSHFPLSLNNKICSCGAWQISDIPCRHAIRAMVHAKIDPHTVVLAWYSVRTYKQSYSHHINPLPDKEQWPAYADLPIIMPPTLKRGVGRPCRNRRREEGEDKKGKRTQTVKCKKCGCLGHNSRTCKGGLTEKEKRAAGGEPVLVRHLKVRDQSNAAKAAKAAATSQPTEVNDSQFSLSQSQSQV
nr:PREDICTED: uncharacterized protein LOC108203301 [Daucus carota subsp. sativus]